jgi:hypothetical protein
MDNQAFRFEDDRERVTAVANMAEPTTAGVLIRKFEELQLKCSPIEWTVANG